MIKITIEELFDNPDQYVDLAEHGEKIIVTKNNKPIVDMVPWSGKSDNS